MRKRAAILLSSAFFALLLSAVWSCGSDSGSPTKPDPDPDPDPPLSHNWTPNNLGLPPADSAVLDSAAARYRTLRIAGDASTARSTLVTALTSGWAGVATAGVTIDGSTIQVNFTDGVKTIIVTDETFDSGGGGQASPLQDRSAPPGLQGMGARSALCISVGGALENSGCTGAVVPSDHKVTVVNPAGATSSTAGAVSTQIRQNLSLLGWDEGDIEVRQSTGKYDRTFTPDDIFNQIDAGLVFMNAEGVVVSKGSPTSGDNTAFAIQAFNGGTYEEYQQHVSTERWAQFDQWQRDGRLIHAKVWSPTTQTMVDQVFIREDLLAEEIDLASNATVHFNVPGSGGTSNLQGIVSAGAASATGWDGPISASQAAGAINQLISNMAGGDGEPLTQAEGLTLLQDQGLGSLTHTGGTSSLVAEVQSQDPLFLPTQVKFNAPSACMPAGTVSYDVSVSYPECPGLNQTFQFTPGEDMSLSGLPPLGAEISYTAKDGAGVTLGAGVYDLDLNGGGNNLDLCPCQGKVEIDISQIASFPGVGAGSQIAGTIDYADASIPDGTFTVDVGDPGTSVEVFGMPGEGTISYTLEDGSGAVLGTSAPQEVDLKCDAPQSSGATFGWIKFSPGRVWSQTDSLFVSGVFSDPDRDPFSLAMFPGAEVTIIDVAVGDSIHFIVEERTPDGVFVDRVEFDHVVLPGENEVTANYEIFGLVLYKDKDRAPSSGLNGVLISAEVRRFKKGDGTFPTGDPISGKDVHLSTTVGGFLLQSHTTNYGPSITKTTNENGWVWAYLTSYENGTATITARMDEPELQLEITVSFETALQIVIDNREESYDGYLLPDSLWIREYCTKLEVYRNGELYDTNTNLEPVGHYYHWQHDLPGDDLTLIWSRASGTCEPGSSGYTGTYLSGAVLHFFRGTNYVDQKDTVIVSAETSLTNPIVFQINLWDPGAPTPQQLPRPAPEPKASPFDLSDPVRFVMKGFR